MSWPFDQAENVAAITTRFVINDDHPILRVVHYDDDHSWAFMCGTSDETNDGRVVAMKTIVAIDPTVRKIADLPPGWGAFRNTVDDEWSRYELDSDL